MNAPERVLKTIEHEEPDRVPYFESTFTNNTIARKFGARPFSIPRGLVPLLESMPFSKHVMKWATRSKQVMKLGLKGTYQTMRNLGMDLVTSPSSLFPRQLHVADDNSRGNLQYIDEFGRIMQLETYHPDGTMIVGYVGGYFKNFEEYESWEQPDPAEPARVASFLAGRELQEDMHDEIFSIPSTAALLEATWEGFGIPAFSRLLTRSKQARKVFGDRGKFTLELVKILAEMDAKMVLLWDDYGFKNGLFMHPKHFRHLVFPWIQRICRAAHRQDCKIFLHSDGDLMEILQDIVDAGVDALNPIEPTTANPDYDIFKLKKSIGNRITLAGNLSPVMLATGTKQEIRSYAERLLREVAPGGGYIFSSGHSINPAVTIDRYITMLSVLRKRGTYPIQP